MKTLAAFVFLFSAGAFATPTRHLSCLKQPDATMKIDLQIENDTTAVFTQSIVTGKPENPWAPVCSSGGNPFEVNPSEHRIDFHGYVYCGIGGQGAIDLSLDLDEMILSDSGTHWLCHWE